MKVIFTLPNTFTSAFTNAPKQHFAFVDWFTRPRADPDSASLMFEVKKQRELGNSEIVGQIIPLSDIRHSVQLCPNFGRQSVNKDWKAETVLDEADSFYINNWGSLHTYQSVY